MLQAWPRHGERDDLPGRCAAARSLVLRAGSSGSGFRAARAMARRSSCRTGPFERSVVSRGAIAGGHCAGSLSSACPRARRARRAVRVSRALPVAPFRAAASPAVASSAAASRLAAPHRRVLAWEAVVRVSTVALVAAPGKLAAAAVAWPPLAAAGLEAWEQPARVPMPVALVAGMCQPALLVPAARLVARVRPASRPRRSSSRVKC